MNFEQAILNQLKANANTQQAVKMADYMKNQFVFYGINSPTRKLICKELYNEYGVPENAIEVAKVLFSQPHRECHYIAQELLLKAKNQWKEHHIEDIEWFILQNSWWDTVDFLASNVVGAYFHKWPENKADIINHWNVSEDIWLIRTAILFQLKYKAKVDTILLANSILPHTQNKAFFIRKAIGWALRSYADVNPSWVISFIENNELQPLSIKEALRKLPK